MADTPRFPKVRVRLGGVPHDRRAIIAAVVRALRDAHASPAVIAEYVQAAMSAKTVNDVLSLSADWVNLTGRRETC